ncbi:hypothetical protein RUND412_003259 [Rhizina undulata]
MADCKKINELVIGVILPGAYQVLDGIGPIDLLQTVEYAPKNAPKITWYYISDTLKPVQPNGGPPQTPNTTYETCPKLDMLILPGRNPFEPPQPGVIEFIQKKDKDTKFMVSVCTGGLIFAQAGILDGKCVMTNKGALRTLIEQCKEPKGPIWKFKGRYEVTPDGKYWTSSGVTAGMDMLAGWMAKYFHDDAVKWSYELAEFEPRPKDWPGFDYLLEGIPECKRK